MAFSQSLNPNVFEKHNRILYLPSSWKRLMSLIKYQVPNGGFALMEGEYGSGKSAFGKIFEKKLVLDDTIDCQLIQIHPLSTIQQIKAQLPKELDKPLLVIIDDAHEASTLLLQKLTSPTENIYWLLLAEPGLADRVDAFADRSVDLPLFTKDDCFEFLQKQLQDQPKYAQMSQMQSDTIWYSSQGLPKDIVEGAKKNFGSLFSGQESNENFEKANKSWYMTAALGAAGFIFLTFIIINLFSGEEETTSEAQELVIETNDKQSLDITNPADNNKPQLADNTVINDNLETDIEDVSTIEDSGTVTDKKQTEPVVEEVPKNSDPIEEIALKVAQEPSPQEAKVSDKESFQQWLSSQSQDSYSLQLFSHSEQSAAKEFQNSVDLADSFVYATDLDGKRRYRVLWGAFKTRAEAQQAIDSLPPEILAQKPWIRQLSSVVNEVTSNTKEL